MGSDRVSQNLERQGQIGNNQQAKPVGNSRCSDLRLIVAYNVAKRKQIVLASSFSWDFLKILARLC
jgi:hypothetical protein